MAAADGGATVMPEALRHAPDRAPLEPLDEPEPPRKPMREPRKARKRASRGEPRRAA